MIQPFVNTLVSAGAKERFDAKWTPEPFSGCWIWTGARSLNGYGVMGMPHINRNAHRISWEIHRGIIPNKICVLHRCDTPSCVNPDHLFLGSLKDNTRDMVKKGRDKKAI